MRVSSAAVLIAGVLLAPMSPAAADQPLPAPALTTIWSRNKAFCAVMDPGKTLTTVYRAGKDGKKVRVWSIPGWFRVAALANDGDHFVTGYPGMNLLDVNHKRDEVMLSFFRRGALISRVTLDRLIRDPSNLKRTTSHVFWGNYLGFDAQGYYVIETVEGRTIRFDVKTGRPFRR